MEKKKLNRQRFIWVLIVWLISIALSVFGYRYGIFLAPNNLLGTTSLYALIWVPGIFMLVKYILSGSGERRNPLLLTSLILILGACSLQVWSIFASSETPNCYSVSEEGLTVSYQCVCREKYEEAAYEHVYEDCQFSGLKFLPIVRKLPATFRRTGVLTPDRSNQADFVQQDWLGQPYDIEYPIQLIIEKFENSQHVQKGYINFQFVKDTNSFEISFIADVACSKYYTDQISIKSTTSTSIKLCGKEMNLKFASDNGNIIVEIQE